MLSSLTSPRAERGLAPAPYGRFFPAMLFWLKKFISFWLMPLPFCLTLLVAGWFLARSKKATRLGHALLGTGLLLLLLFSNKVVSTWLVSPLESRFPPIPELRDGAALPAHLAACRYVVVLGGGHGDMPGLSANNKLSGAALARIVEGVRLMRALPGAQLIVSGPGVGDNPTHASVLAQAAAQFGTSPTRITRIEHARDTEDEAHAVKAIAGDAPVVLVTSAWHLPRAVALFRRAGVQVVPCPTDFTARTNADFRLNDLNWDTDSLQRSTWAVRERIGYLWLWLQRKV